MRDYIEGLLLILIVIIALLAIIWVHPDNPTVVYPEPPPRFPGSPSVP